MRILFFDDYRLGVMKGDRVVDVSDVVAGIARIRPHDLLRGVIESWSTVRPAIETAVEAREGVALDAVRVRPPAPQPTNIVCMAVNYMEGRAPGDRPPKNAFHKSPGSVIGDGDTMILPDVPATIFEGEAELALIIGRHASGVPAADAMGYVFGYTNFIDGSARGLVPETSFYPMKARATFAPIGPFIVTADEVPEPQHLTIRLWNNGALMQEFNTDDMAHKIPECIEFVSSVHDLEPGDVLATGTDHQGLNPFMDGDRIEIEGEGLGRLTVQVRDDLHRTWDRVTRKDHWASGAKGATPQLTGKYAPVNR
jgi:2-keto-4-pentenoate hydratase/2-oxohepta-3-ene-1,7-dioic acid hydratase in catechol pathway